MGMSHDMAPKIVALDSTGLITYILDTNIANIAQVQLAVPVTEVLVVGDDVKSVRLCESPMLITDIPTENINWLGSNVIVIVSQAENVIVVDSASLPDGDIAQKWYGDSATASTALASLSEFFTKLLSQVNSGDEQIIIYEGELAEEICDEDARKWVQDSIISVAALASLNSCNQSNESF